jgi:glutamine amidotransferase
MSSRIAILDYGMGNLHSAAKAVQRIADGAEVRIVADKQGLAQADRIIFPGVGAIRDCMAALQQQDLIDTLQNCLQNKPVLAICVGMQALLESSEENQGVRCLNFFRGQIIRFQPTQASALKIPHMGWNQVQQMDATHPLWQKIPQSSRFYFVHSYHAVNVPKHNVLATCDYGSEFPCAIAQDNVCAVQFHPEKSQQVGLQLLHNFVHHV